MGFNRWHAFGFRDNEKLAVTSSCSPVMFEESSQGYDAIGRADIREAIDSAEVALYRYMGFWPAPKFYEAEAQFPKLPDRRMVRSGPYDADMRWRNVRLNDAWIQNCGVEGLTVIQLNAPVTLTDVTGDGYYDYFQVGPIATSLTDPKEIVAFFNANDRWDGTDIDEKWRIQPLQVSISGGQLTIRGRPWLIGLPVLSQGISPDVLDPIDPASFASSLDIYRRFVNTGGTTTDTSQAVVMWETRPCHGWWCCCYGCTSLSSQFTGAIYDPASTASATARVAIRDGRRGIVCPAEAAFNASTGMWEGFPTSVCWEPDRFLIRLYAGYPLDTDGRMSKRLRDTVARLTAAELQQSICGCAEAERRVYHWQQDLSKVGADKELFSVSAKQLDNPLGTRRGHAYAWNTIEEIARVSGVRL